MGGWNGSPSCDAMCTTERAKRQSFSFNRFRVVHGNGGGQNVSLYSFEPLILMPPKRSPSSEARTAAAPLTKPTTGKASSTGAAAAPPVPRGPTAPPAVAVNLGDTIDGPSEAVFDASAEDTRRDLDAFESRLAAGGERRGIAVRSHTNAKPPAPVGAKPPPRPSPAARGPPAVAAYVPNAARRRQLTEEEEERMQDMADVANLPDV